MASGAMTSSKIDGGTMETVIDFIFLGFKSAMDSDCSLSVEISALNLMKIPFYVTCCFSLAAFNIFYLYLIFFNFINMCLGVILFVISFILYGTLWAS